MSHLTIQFANEILSVDNFLQFVEAFYEGYKQARTSPLKFVSFNPELLHQLIEKIGCSKNKEFREKLERGSFIRQPLQNIHIRFQ